MKKEDAIKILETNICWEIEKKWIIYQMPLVIVLVVFEIISDVFHPSLQLPNLALPPSPLSDVNIIPPIFTGTVTTFSILIGFFSVSAHNFRQWLGTQIEQYFGDWSQAVVEKHRLLELKEELEERKKNSSQEGLKEIQENAAKLDNALRRQLEYEELLNLNKDAYAHQEEHIGKFVFTYLSVSFVLLLSYLTLFYALPISKIFLWYFIEGTTFILNASFAGLIVFLHEYMRYTVHHERI